MKMRWSRVLNKNGLLKDTLQKKKQIALKRVSTMSKGSRALKLEQKDIKFTARKAHELKSIGKNTESHTYTHFMITFVNWRSTEQTYKEAIMYVCMPTGQHSEVCSM